MPFDHEHRPVLVAASMARPLAPVPTLQLVQRYMLSQARSAIGSQLSDCVWSMIGKPSVIIGLTRAGGATLMGIGILTATLRRAT